MSCVKRAGFGANTAKSGRAPASGLPLTGRAEKPQAAVCSLNLVSLARFVATAFPHAAAANLAFLIGRPQSTTEKWLRGETAPDAAGLAAMIGAFGPSFIAACLTPPPAWAEDAARAERLAALKAEIADLEQGGTDTQGQVSAPSVSGKPLTGTGSSAPSLSGKPLTGTGSSAPSLSGKPLTGTPEGGTDTQGPASPLGLKGGTDTQGPASPLGLKGGTNK